MTFRDSHPAAAANEALLTMCTVRRTRRSGPGGQNRNKVETAVVVSHRPSGISAEANERRSQAENLGVALFRLRRKLAVEVRARVNLEDGPSPLWQSRCVAGRIAVNPEHGDFPALLAEALDVLEAYQLEIKDAGAYLGCSPTQLTRFLKLEPRVLTLLNERRVQLGLRPLR